MMENLNQLLMKQRQQQEEVKQHEQLKQKQAQQLAAQQAGLSGSMTPLALQQMLNHKSKPSHPAIEQLQKNLRQASSDSQQQEQQQAQLAPPQAPLRPPSVSPGIPSIDVNMSLNERGDLSLGAVVGGTDALAKAQKKKVIRQQQKRLILLRHASKCNKGPSCKTKFCPQMVVLWKHMKKCRDKSCKTPHCLSSRCVLNHYRICKGENRTNSCGVCAPVMKHIRSQAAANGEDGDQMDELAEEVRIVSSHDLNMMGIEGTGIGGVAGDNHHQHQSQLQDQHAQQDSGRPTSASEAQHIEELQAAQQKLQQQQLLLQQLQQQQAQLVEQQKQLQQQQEQVLPQTQQGQQLQQQQTLLQKLQQEFQQQQQLLQHELQRQSLILQRGQQVQMEHQMSVSGANTSIDAQSASSDGNKRKRSSDGGGKRFNNKVARARSSPTMRQKRAAGAVAGGQPPSQRYRTSDGAEVDNNGKPRKKTTEGTIDTVTSLIPSMTTASIIEHLDSLQGGFCLTPRRLGHKCLPIIRKLINDPCGWVFRDAVDPVELCLPDYFDVVKKPMHLALIEQKLESGAYKDMAEFREEVRLVFDNAILYNGENSDVGEMASDMLKSFEREDTVLQKGMSLLSIRF